MFASALGLVIQPLEPPGAGQHVVVDSDEHPACSRQREVFAPDAVLPPAGIDSPAFEDVIDLVARHGLPDRTVRPFKNYTLKSEHRGRGEFIRLDSDWETFRPESTHRPTHKRLQKRCNDRNQQPAALHRKGSIHTRPRKVYVPHGNRHIMTAGGMVVAGSRVRHSPS